MTVRVSGPNDGNIRVVIVSVCRPTYLYSATTLNQGHCRPADNTRESFWRVRSKPAVISQVAFWRARGNRCYQGSLWQHDVGKQPHQSMLWIVEDEDLSETRCKYKGATYSSQQNEMEQRRWSDSYTHQQYDLKLVVSYQCRSYT